MCSTLSSANKANLEQIYGLRSLAEYDPDAEFRHSLLQRLNTELEAALSFEQWLQEWLQLHSSTRTPSIAPRRKPAKQKERLDAIEREIMAECEKRDVERRHSAEESPRRAQYSNPLNRVAFHPPGPNFAAQPSSIGPPVQMPFPRSEASRTGAGPRGSFVYRSADSAESKMPGHRINVRPSLRGGGPGYPGMGVMMPSVCIPHPDDLRPR